MGVTFNRPHIYPTSLPLKKENWVGGDWLTHVHLEKKTVTKTKVKEINKNTSPMIDAKTLFVSSSTDCANASSVSALWPADVSVVFSSTDAPDVVRVLKAGSWDDLAAEVASTASAGVTASAASSTACSASSAAEKYSCGSAKIVCVLRSLANGPS